MNQADEIQALLDSYNVDTLFYMASAAMLPVARRQPRARKAVLLDRLSAELFTPERIAASLARLSRRDRLVLDRLILNGGPIPTRVFKRELIRAGLATESPTAPAEDSPYLPSGSYRPPYAVDSYIGRPERAQSPVFADVIARLTGQGLVFSRLGPRWLETPVPPKLQFHPADELFIPEAVLRHLPAPPVPVADAPLQPERVQEADPAPLLRDLYLYWDFCRRNPVAVTKSGYVGKRGLRAINDVLLAPDPLLETARNEAETGRLAMLRELLRIDGVLALMDGHLCSNPPQLYPVPDYWLRPEVDLLAGYLRHWPSLLLTALSAEAERYDAVVESGRRALLQALAAAPVGAWLEPAGILDRAYALDRGLFFPERQRVEALPGNAYCAQPGFYGRAADLLAEMDRLDVLLTEQCLTGFLHETGVVDLGYDGEQLRAVRITPLGQEILRRLSDRAEGGPEPAVAPPAEDEGKVIIQPSFQILAIGPVSLGVLAHLDLLADRQRAGLGAFEYQLTRDSVYRAQQSGMDAAAVLRYLEAASAMDLPQNVRRSLAEWALHQERIVFRSGVSLIQTVTPELLGALNEDPRTAPLISRPIAPQVAILRRGAEKLLVQALVERGEFPTVCGAQPHSADHSVTVEEDGTVRSVHAVPNLFLYGRLQRLAEAGPAGVWRITPASIARVGGSKARALRLLDDLASLHRGDLPAQLVEQIKAWAGYYGDAAAQALTLIEFRDPTTLAELLEKPELRALLKPFRAGERALAVVAEGKLAQAEEVLAGLGVRVRAGLSFLRG